MHVGFLNIFMFVRNRSLPGPRFRLPELRGTLKAAVVFFFSYDQYLRQRRLQHTWQSTVVPPLWCNVRPWNKVILLLQDEGCWTVASWVDVVEQFASVGGRHVEKRLHIRCPLAFQKICHGFSVSVGIGCNIGGRYQVMSKIVLSQSAEDMLNCMTCKMQDFHAKVDWLCTRNSTLRVQGISFLRCRLLVFGACFLTWSSPALISVFDLLSLLMWYHPQVCDIFAQALPDFSLQLSWHLSAWHLLDLARNAPPGPLSMRTSAPQLPHHFTSTRRHFGGRCKFSSSEETTMASS